MFTPQGIRLILAAALFVFLLVALTMTYNLGSANASGSTQQQGEKEERHLEDLIPKHVPLRIKIKKEKEKEFKDLNNDRWARDFELEVTNVGDKPIYQFYLTLIFDVKDASGQNVSAPVYYGRAELGDHRVRARPEDVPLKPGESCTLKIHPGQLDAWDIVQRTEGRRHPKSIKVQFEMLSFGDWSGLMGPDAIAVPRKIGK